MADKDLSQFPLGATDFDVFMKNVENEDKFVNSEEHYFEDRKHKNRYTLAGLESLVETVAVDGEERITQAIINAGYQFLGDYAAGIVVTEYNQVIRDADGEFWRVSGGVDLPYTTTGAGMPEDGAFIAVGEAILRVDLAAKSGAGIVGYSHGETSDVGTVADALKRSALHVMSIESFALDNPNANYGFIFAGEMYAGTGDGRGLYEIVDSTYSAPDKTVIGGVSFKPVTDNLIFPVDTLGAKRGDGAGTAAAFIKAIECVKHYGRGTVLFPRGDWLMDGVMYEVNQSDIEFYFSDGCHLTAGYVLLGWYPTGVGTGHKNVSFTGKGTIEQDFNTQWGNDLVFVDGVELSDITFIRPITSGHFLDLMGADNVSIKNIKVFGSSITRRSSGTPRLYSEFVQVGNALSNGLQWVEKREQYAPFMQGEETGYVDMLGCAFMPHKDEDGITYPPRPIGNHGAAQAPYRNAKSVHIERCRFEDIVAISSGDRRSYALEFPSIDSVTLLNCHLIANRGVEASWNLISANRSFIKVLSSTFDADPETPFFVPLSALYAFNSDLIFSGNIVNINVPDSDIIAIQGSGSENNFKSIVSSNEFNCAGRGAVYAEPSSGAEIKLIIDSNSVNSVGTDEPNLRHCFRSGGAVNSVVSNNYVNGWYGFCQLGIATVSGNFAENLYSPSSTAKMSIGNGSFTGNVIKGGNGSRVTIGGAVQTENEWNYKYIP